MQSGWVPTAVIDDKILGAFREVDRVLVLTVLELDVRGLEQALDAQLAGDLPVARDAGEFGFTGVLGALLGGLQRGAAGLTGLAGAS